MISFKKSKSHIVAAIGTILIHLLLLGLLSLDYFGQNSSALSDAEMENLELMLDKMDAEDISIFPPGRDQLSNEKDKSSESLSKQKGLAKIKPSAAPLSADAKPEDDVPQIRDTIAPPKIKDIVFQQNTDSATTPRKDSLLVSQIAKTEKAMKKFNSDDERKKALARYNFYQQNFRSIRNFKVVYPYALKTKEIIDKLNAQLSTMTNEREKAKLINDTEKMLFREYESAVRTMTTSQGRLLLKLIARETSLTGYDIIREYQGSIPASFWYGVGKLFGTDLKSEFHKQKEDSLIETIVAKYKDNELY